MRFLGSACIALMFGTFNAVPCLATEGPWCLKTAKSGLNCSIPTEAMCNFVALPENGACWPNPNYRGAAEVAPRKAERRTRHTIAR